MIACIDQFVSHQILLPKSLEKWIFTNIFPPDPLYTATANNRALYKNRVQYQVIF